MDVTPPTSQFKDASTQTETVFILDVTPDPTKVVIAEDVHLSKLAAYNKNKNLIAAKQQEFMKNVMIRDDKDNFVLLNTNTNPIPNSTSIIATDLGTTKASPSKNQDEPYVPQFTSTKTAVDFEKLSITAQYPNVAVGDTAHDTDDESIIYQE